MVTYLLCSLIFKTEPLTVPNPCPAITGHLLLIGPCHKCSSNRPHCLIGLSLEGPRESLSESSRAQTLLLTGYINFSFLSFNGKDAEGHKLLLEEGRGEVSDVKGMGNPGSDHVTEKSEAGQEDLRLANFLLPSSSLHHHPPRKEKNSPLQAVPCSSWKHLPIGLAHFYQVSRSPKELAF